MGVVTNIGAIGYVLIAALEIAYLYVLSCLLVECYEGKNRKYFLILGLFVLAAFILPILPSFEKEPCSYNPKAQCLAQINSVPSCYSAEGRWLSDQIGLDASSNGITIGCLCDGGSLENTPYKYDEIHFNCGPKPA